MRLVLVGASACAILAGVWLLVLGASDWSYSGVGRMGEPAYAGYAEKARYQMAAGAALIVGGVMMGRAK